MVRELARIALVTKIEALKAAWLTYPLMVEYGNLPKINLTNQVNPYLRVNLVWLDGYQVDLAKNPKVRLLGSIVLEACVKEGGGTKKAAELLSHFYPSLQMADDLAPIRTHAAKFRSSVENGWLCDSCTIPFWVD